MLTESKIEPFSCHKSLVFSFILNLQKIIIIKQIETKFSISGANIVTHLYQFYTLYYHFLGSFGVVHV